MLYRRRCVPELRCNPAMYVQLRLVPDRLRRTQRLRLLNGV
jgi:hypothetical protein